MLFYRMDGFRFPSNFLGDLCFVNAFPYFRRIGLNEQSKENIRSFTEINCLLLSLDSGQNRG